MERSAQLSAIGPVNVTNSIYDQGNLTIRCTKIANVTQYHVQLNTLDGRTVFNAVLTDTNTSTDALLMTHGQSIPPNTYILSIRPIKNGNIGVLNPRYSVTWGDLPVQLLQPTIKSLSYDGQLLSITWDNPGDATRAILELLDTNGKVVFQQSDLSIPPVPLPIDGLENAALYTARVRDVTTSAESNWSVGVPFQYVKLPAPTGLQLTYTQNKLQATWNALSLPFLVLGANALVFNGSNSYVSVPASPSLNALSTATWEVWFRPSGHLGEKKVLWRELPAGIQTKWTNGVISVGALPTANDTWHFVDAPGFAPNQWYHVAGVVDGKSLLLYINGHLYGSTPCSSLVMGVNEWHWGRWNSLGYDLKGQMAEVRIWNMARRGGYRCNPVSTSCASKRTGWILDSNVGCTC